MAFKKFLAAVGGIVLIVLPAAGGILLLAAFWDDLADLTVSAYDDIMSHKAWKALKADPHADVRGFFVHVAAARESDARRRRGRGWARKPLAWLVGARRKAVAWAQPKDDGLLSSFGYRNGKEGD